MTTTLTIRPMQKEDNEEATYIMASAFGRKMPAMGKFSEAEIAEFLSAGGVFDENVLNRHYVAVADGQVAGIMHLETLPDKLQKRTPTKDVIYMFRRFGFFRVMISAISLFFLESKLDEDEMIVDFVAVHPNYRGQGIGSQLLVFGEEVARETEGIIRYTLGVIDENKDARRLYERKGFVVYKTKSSKILKIFTGVETSHKLEKFL